MKVYKLHDNLYRVNLNIVLKPTLKRIKKFFSTYDGITSEQRELVDWDFTLNSEGFVHWFSDQEAVMGFSSEMPQVETFLHEVFHFAFGVFRKRGITLCRESEEAFAYYQSHVFDRIRDKIVKKEEARREKAKNKKKGRAK